MDKETIARATKLLAKAQATTFDGEAAALTGKAYRLLADALNAHDDQAASAGAARKRERRHLADRRSSSGSSIQGVPRRNAEQTTIDTRRINYIDLAPRGHVDLRI
jgi:Protein of unknown function (DUF2786)